MANVRRIVALVGVVLFGLLHATMSLAQTATKSAAESNKSKSTSTSESSDVIAKTEIDRGLIKVRLEFSPNPVQLSDEPTLTLIIDSQPGVKVDKPPFMDSIPGFVVRDFRETLPEIQGDRITLRQIYRLEPLESGNKQLDPLVIKFTDGRANGDGKEHSIELESLAVEVTSFLENEAPSLDSLKAMADPVEISERRTSRTFWGVVVGAIAICFVIGIWRWRSRRRTIVERQLTPQEMAYLELDALLQENLAESDVKLFYVRLTDIVRRFIEGTTGIHAPEQTTEEFLREVGRGQTFSGEERRRLKDFLESADLVKFAAQEPSAADIEATFNRAKAFLGLSSASVSSSAEIATGAGP